MVSIQFDTVYIRYSYLPTVPLIDFTWLVTWNVIVIHRHIKEHLKEQYGFDDERANKYLKVSFTFTIKLSSG